MNRDFCTCVCLKSFALSYSGMERERETERERSEKRNERDLCTAHSWGRTKFANPGPEMQRASFARARKVFYC